MDKDELVLISVFHAKIEDFNEISFHLSNTMMTTYNIPELNI